VLPLRAAAPALLLRVHVHPKRFPAAYSVDWQQRIIAENHEYVVVDKPPGVQVSEGPTGGHTGR